MFIRWLDADDVASEGRPLHLRQPTWKDVDAAIRKLDGFRHTEVSLMVKEGIGMNITGGSEKYVCQVLTTGGCSVLLNPGAEDKSVPITKNGPADYPEKWTTSLDVVLKAAKTYAELGETDRTLSWSEI